MGKTVTMWTTSDHLDEEIDDDTYLWAEQDDALDNCLAVRGRRLLRVTLKVTKVDDLGPMT